MGKITYNTRLIFDSKTDESKIFEVLEAQCLAWNECSKIQYNIPKNSIVFLHTAFYRYFRDIHPEIPAQVVISAEQSVLSSYRAIKSNKHKIAEPPIKKNLSMRLDDHTYSIKNKVLSLISLGKRVKCTFQSYPKLEEYYGKYRLCDPELFVKNGEIWVGMTFDIPEMLPTQTLACGVDLGIRINATTSEGNLYFDKKFNKRKRRIRFLKRKLQSKGTKSAKRHLKKLSRKESNINKNFSHHLANKILADTKADVIVLEDLKGIKVKKHKRQNKNRISQIPFFELRRILTYKAPMFNRKTVIFVSPEYTSQIDHKSGKKDGIRNGRRYISKSGIIYDADINAAINIGVRSKLPVSQTKNLTYGQAIVNSPIVCKSNR